MRGGLISVLVMKCNEVVGNLTNELKRLNIVTILMFFGNQVV